MSNQVTGRVFIALNGRRLRSKPGATLNPGGFTREPKTSDIGVDGFSEAVAVPTVECTINHKGDTSLQELADTRSASLTFESDTGKVWLLREAWLSEPPTLTGGGDASLKFAAVACEES